MIEFREQYIPHFLTACSLSAFSQLDAVTFSKINHHIHTKLPIKTCQAWQVSGYFVNICAAPRRAVQPVTVSGAGGLRGNLGRGIKYLFAAGDCREWDVLQY